MKISEQRIKAMVVMNIIDNCTMELDNTGQERYSLDENQFGKVVDTLVKNIKVIQKTDELEKKVATDLSEIDRPYYIDSFGVAGKTDEFKMITKNHMPSKELCEGIIALQQLISFRDNFHEVNGRNTSKISKYVLRLGTSGWSVGNVHGRVTFRELFEFDNLTQAENFLKYHKDLFNELKKLY